MKQPVPYNDNKAINDAVEYYFANPDETLTSIKRKFNVSNWGLTIALTKAIERERWGLLCDENWVFLEKQHNKEYFRITTVTKDGVKVVYKSDKSEAEIFYSEQVKNN